METNQPEPAPFRIQRLNHAVLYVGEIERATRFYSEVLGFEVSSRIEAASAVFLRAPGSENHHDLGLFGLGSGARHPGRGGIGLYHLAWQLATVDELAAARTRLHRAEALVGESSHGATKSIYGTDPDGNEFELMWMLPRDSWGPFANDAIVEPLDLQVELATWSGVVTA